MLGGGSVEGVLPSERCSRVTFSGSSSLQEPGAQKLIPQFLEKSAIVSKTAQYVGRMLP